MVWPKIERDETNTKVTNKEYIISFVNNCYYLFLLENYLSQLKVQNKVDVSEVQPIIEATQNRINTIKLFLEGYENSKDETILLADFYENNIDFIEGIVKLYKIQEENEIDKKTMKILVDFLMFCVNKEKNNEINKRQTQMVFEEFYQDSKYINDEEYGKLLKGIYDAHKAILNKIDDSAMEYKEVGYTKVLTNINNNGYKLTEEDENITKLNSAAFITTAVILQATLVLSLIFSLFAIVK